MRPSALSRKLLRDLWILRGQAIAIAAVVASGVAMWVISFSTITSLDTTQRAFYNDYAFAEVFAGVTRAPAHMAARVRDLEGIAALQTRVTGRASLDVPRFNDPVNARLVSLPERGPARLNQLYVKQGRRPAPGATGEIVVSVPFAEAHGLGPGDRLEATIHGRKRTLTITGTGLSPEFVYQIQPGAMFPDYRRYAIGWMRRPALAAAYDMEGAFNDLALTLRDGTSPAAVMPALDRLLAPYGGTGAYTRADQASHKYLDQEMEQLRNTAVIVPLLFLGVAAFLLNIVTERTIRQQREQVAVLKAFGYRDRTIGGHYLLLVSAMVLLGAIPGVAIGAWAGHGLAAMYGGFFHYPYLAYHLAPATALAGVGVALLAALAGTLRAVATAVRLPPAEAMRPEPPPIYRATLVERLGLQRWLDQPTRMILRHLERHPAKSLLSVLGIALAGAILMVGNFQEDALDYMMNVQFDLAAREDLTVTLADPSGRDALFEMTSLPGVNGAQPFRSVPVELVHGPRRHRTAIQGVPATPRLHRLLDRDNQPITLPGRGLLMSRWLGDALAVETGDQVTVELLDGSGATHRIRIAGLVDDMLGVSAYMRLDALNRLLGEGPLISGAYLAVEPGREAEALRALERRPRVAAISPRTAAIESFEETLGDTLLIFAFVNTVLAGSIALGVVYNAARLAYAERARELGSLRILGFTRGQTAYILLGELALLTLAALPLAFALGWAFCQLVVAGLASELYRVPLVIEPSTYAFSAAVILVAAVLSAIAVARRLNRMDLVAVLKIRE
ncbi:ABC transporter permease [Halofilum ochraceum]|uniref:ABC transporter permease n=1 Tax=Halofilum ochraceum TaxID=1611323 RepID=UPI001FDEDD1C|nr:ABC transporter permease [Halofilum ochraceum]